MEYIVEQLFHFSLLLLSGMFILYLLLSIILWVSCVNDLLSLRDDLEEIVVEHRELKEEREIRDKYIEYRDKYESIRSSKIKSKKDD